MPERISADDMVRKIYDARMNNDAHWTIYVEWPDEPILRIQKIGEPDSKEFIGPDPMSGEVLDYMEYLLELDLVTDDAPLIRIPRCVIEEQLATQKAAVKPEPKGTSMDSLTADEFILKLEQADKWSLFGDQMGDELCLYVQIDGVTQTYLAPRMRELGTGASTFWANIVTSANKPEVKTKMVRAIHIPVR